MEAEYGGEVARRGLPSWAVHPQRTDLLPRVIAQCFLPKIPPAGNTPASLPLQPQSCNPLLARDMEI